jgi:hypothetical protein
MSLKRLNIDDVNTIPYQAHKQYKLNYNNLPNVCGSGSDSDVKIYTGKKLDGNFYLPTEPKTNGYYQRSIYDNVNRLFYQQYSGSSIHSSSFHSYNHNQDLVKDFPTEIGSVIRVLDIPQSMFGNEIQPTFFKLNSDSFNIEDDGNGNLIDTISDDLVGNIFYQQGIVVVTNQNYFCLFPVEPTVFPKKYTFLKNETKIIDLLSDAITYCSQTLDSSTLQLLNLSDGFTYTNNNSSITFTNSSLGTYTAQYLVKDSLGICSNISDIEINVIENCDFDLTIPNPTLSDNNCLSRVADFQIIKKSNQVEVLPSNNIFVSLTDVIKTSTRNNGINNYSYIFDTDQNYNISFSKDGGLTYFTISELASRVIIDTSLSNPYTYLRNAYNFNLKVKSTTNESYVEYHFKMNPMTGEYSFNKIKDYVDLNALGQINQIYNEYKVVSNHCNISTVQWAFTGEMSGIPTYKDSIMLFGCRGDVIATIYSDCCPTTTKTITFNGNCLEPTCVDSQVELELIPTNTKNNYIIFANTNFYLKEFPNWQFNGGVKFVSDINSNYLEVIVDDSYTNSSLIYQTKDFCKTLSSQLTFNQLASVDFTTTLPSSTSTSTTINSEIEISDLELTFYSSTTTPLINTDLDFTIVIQNKGNSNATNLVIKLEYDNNFIINTSSISSYDYTFENGYYLFSKDELIVGDSFVIRFKGKFNGNVGDVKQIKSQVWEVDQYDPNSIAGNGYNNEDDNKTLSLTLSNISSTTTIFNCNPIIREYPYTNFVCGVSNDNRGIIIVSALNPFTKDSSGLEYSFNGDVDLYYTENNQSNYLPNGLYTVWVRLKSNKSCKISTKVRIACLNGQQEPTWLISGNNCVTSYL